MRKHADFIIFYEGMARNRKTIFVALSGGVDSSVAAALLNERGFDVRGVHIKMWSDPKIPCTTKEDRYDAMRVAAKLNIPFETWDFTAEYRNAVVDYMIHEYAAARTPNPDVMCNREIKFGAFLNRAIERGADYIATGHYVRLMRNSLKLKIAKDTNKDQSYFLWTLTQQQLARCLFPIGQYLKAEVRELARKFDLPTAEKKDSQGLCFMGKINVSQFLKEYVPERRGEIFTTANKKVGEHSGLGFYTIGQRHGIRIGGGGPYYVAAKDFTANRLIVAEGNADPNLYKNELTATHANWISGKAQKLPLQCEARIRYRQPLQKCAVRTLPTAGYQLQAIFDRPQRAVASGQSIVFYKGDEMLGGAIIE